MNIDWAEIKEEIIRDIDDIFIVNIPQYPNVSEGIELFKKVIYSNVGGFFLGGLHREIVTALQDAYKDKIGQIAPLKTLANGLEPYLKKLCVISGKDTQTGAMNKDLMPLLKTLNLNTSLSTQSRGGYPQLIESNLSSFVGQPEYLEFICEAYLTRNKVHESPNWNRREVIKRLTSVMCVYILSANKYKTEIDALPDNQPVAKELINKISEEEKYLYHFIAFGNTTHKIKNQIISSFILNYIKENQPTTIELIHSSANKHFDNNLEINRYRSLVTNLENENRVHFNKVDKSFSLNEEEYKRISSVQENFNENRNIFFLFLEDIAKKYGIENLISELFDKLQEFIEHNYNIDFSEAYDKGVEIEKDENQVYQQFIAYIQTISPDKDTSNRLFRDLLELSVDSDFLLRMSASRAFANLTNPEKYEQYINQQERIVYLDTQIILYALCLNYVEKANYGNYLYETTEELIELTKKNRNIKLKTSRLYLQEVAYQLKLALLLIPFEDVGGKRLSSNVFYQFYWHLKENGLLEEEDETFADFMSFWFRLEEDDAYDNRFYGIVYNNVIEFLSSSDLQVEVETIPIYDKSAAVDAIDSVIYSEIYYKSRPKNVIDNDAIMLCHLCNKDLHIIEPFFLTWDKLFVKFRKSYINKNKRNEISTFHLFNPARFISHLSLTKFKINPTAITNDFLSIIDSYNTEEKNNTFWDVINKFLNIDNIGKLKRTRYANKIKEIIEREFNSPDDLSDRERILSPFEGRFEVLNDYYSTSSKYTIIDYRNLLLTEEYFDEVTSVIFDTSSDNNVVIQKIDLLIKRKLDSTNNPSIENFKNE